MGITRTTRTMAVRGMQTLADTEMTSPRITQSRMMRDMGTPAPEMVIAIAVGGAIPIPTPIPITARGKEIRSEGHSCCGGTNRGPRRLCIVLIYLGNVKAWERTLL